MRNALRLIALTIFGALEMFAGPAPVFAGTTNTDATRVTARILKSARAGRNESGDLIRRGPQTHLLGRAVFSHARPGWPRVVVCVPVAANGINMANRRKPLPENEHKKKPSASVPKAWGDSFRGHHFFISSFFVLSFISPFAILTDTT